MQKIVDMNLRTRIFLGHISSLFLLMLLSGSIYWNIANREHYSDAEEASDTTVMQLNQLSHRLDKMTSDLRGQILFPANSSYRESYTSEVKQYQETAANIVDALNSADNRKQMTGVLAAVKQFEAIADQIFTLIEAGKVDQATLLLNQLPSSQVNETLNKILVDENARLEERRAKEESTSHTLLTVVTVGTLLTAAIILLLGGLVSARISQKMQTVVNHITASSNEIAATVEQQEQIVHQQATSVNQTTTTMDELEASFRQASEQAKAAAIAAKQALELTENGTQAVGKNLEGMFLLEKEVEQIADQMLHLSEQAHQIYSISELVSDIATQTNMLALNSSVEASRAGEHGRGFSVVANEIRKLAGQSQRAAEKINDLVSQIQSAINSTVMVTEKGSKMVTAEVEIAKKTEQAFAGVEDAVSRVVINNQQISLNLKQQLDGIQQVVQAIEVINQGAQETAIGISQTRAGAQQLNEIALELKRLT
jgi:methyl-accepting chemotaxis protein